MKSDIREESPYNQRSKSLRSKGFLGDLLYLFRGKGIDALEEVVDIFFPTVVKETLSEVEGKALAVVARHAKLTLYLTFSCIELRSA